MENEDKDPDASLHKPPSVSQVVEELKELWGMTLPITTMNFLVFLRQVVSVLFLGRIGSLELAGGALSIGFTNITGYSVMVGLAAGLEPICSQAYGSKNWDLLSISLQRMILILLIATIPIGLLWLNLETIMVFLGQDHQISKMAAIYCFYSLPDLLINTLLQPLKTFLRSQKETKPMMYCTLLAVGFHVPMNYLMVVVMGMGVRGVAMASVLTNLSIVGLMSGYVWVWGRNGEMRWRVEMGEVCGSLGPMMKLAVPSCLGICLEWWWYEIVTVLAGYLPNPTSAVAATGILIQTTSMMYTVPLALSGCVSARVGNELGAGKPRKAKLAAMVALGCAFIIGLINVMWTVILRKGWSSLFTDDVSVKALVTAALPIIGLCELWNCPQTTGYGILRGTARPAVGARINLVSFYLVGTPVAVGLAFGLKVGFVGLWFGLLSAQVACAVSMLYSVVAQTDWDAEALKAKKLTGLEMMTATNGVKEKKSDSAEEESKELLADENGHQHFLF